MLLRLAHTLNGSKKLCHVFLTLTGQAEVLDIVTPAGTSKHVTVMYNLEGRLTDISAQTILQKPE